jgi:arylsulfatase A-like enzyme
VIPRSAPWLRQPALLLLACLAGCGPSGTEVPAGKGLNVLLSSIDTLRADHLGCYGYQRPTSPHLDAFANESVRFAQAISQAPWTTPSHMTLMTSLYPSSHGVNRSWDEYAAAPRGTGTFRALSPDHVTLAQVLKDNGYETLALTGGATVSADLGFGHGFDEFVEPRGGATFWGEIGQVWNQLGAWLDRPRDKPFFLFFHTFEVHAPYVHPELAGDILDDAQMRELRAQEVSAPRLSAAAQSDYLKSQGIFDKKTSEALYDGGIRFVDAFLGRLFEDLRRRGLYDRTLIVVVSDHGEAFGEHGDNLFYGAHGWALYEELIHVPLLVRFPPLARKPRVSSQLVGLIDVTPMILDLLGIEIPKTMEGRARARALVEDDDAYPWIASGATSSRPVMKAWREDRYKYIATFKVSTPDGDPSFVPGPIEREELYDLIEDPGEQHNLSRIEAEVTRLKRSLLLRHLESLREKKRLSNPLVVSPNEDLQKQLKALGYL